MDKLEKALHKARQLRAAHLSGAPSVVSAAAYSPASSSAPRVKGVPVVPSGTIVLDEEVLEANRILAHHPKDPKADLFRILRAQILQTMAKHGFRTLAITSSNYGDGKTTIATNLAISIAQDMNQTVLLADLDLRKPSIHTYLGLEPAVGLTDFLAGRAQIPACLMRLPLDRLTVLPAGNAMQQSSEVLGSPQMAALATELKTRYPDRLVIYDMPPLLAQDDPLTFLPHVDAVLLIVRDGVTATADIKRSLDILSSATVLGTVLNDQMSLVPASFGFK